MSKFLRLSSLVSVALTMGACGDLADADYRGESQLTLRGTVENPQSLTVADDDTHAWLLWLPAEGGASVVADETPVEATFPADFTLQVLQPPPDSVIAPFDGGRVAVGVVLFMTVAQKDTALAQLDSGEDLDAGVVGLANGLVYFLPDEASVTAFGLTDRDGNPAVVGFNVVGVVTGDCVDDEGDDATCEGSALVPNDTPVPVKLVDTDVVDGLTIGG